MSTIHNPTHFEPSDYDVLAYLDNVRPALNPWHIMTDESLDAYKAEVAAWEREMELYLGHDWRALVNRCVHCGNGSVRWITVVKHIPTNANLVFGATCTARLQFPDRKAFQLALLQKRAAAHKESLRVWTLRCAYIANHPMVAKAIEVINEPVHAKNFFARDILAKLDKYGAISDKQRTAMLESMQRDRTMAAARAAEPPAGPAPSGRVNVEGEVVALKVHENEFGSTLKCLLKLANGAKLWCTVPSAAREDVQRGDTLHMTVTCEVKPGEPSFAFGKRPTLIEHRAKTT